MTRRNPSTRAKRCFPRIGQPCRLRLEALEQRTLLACDVFVRDDTLFIRGDDRDNAVSLAADGQSVQVICDSARALHFDGIRRVAADLGAGNDVFAAELTVPPDPVSPEPVAILLSVRGGLGDDDISARMGIDPQPFMPNVLFEVNADGGDGNDSLSASAVVVPGTLAGFNPQPEPPIVHVAARLRGGEGDDDISARMGVEPTPFLPVLKFDVLADGGDGNDTLSASAVVAPGSLVGFNPQPEPPIFNIAMRGGLGDDDISARMGIEPTPFLPNVVTNLRIGGDAGDDSVSVIAEVNAVMGISPDPFQPTVSTTVNVGGGDGDDQISVLADINAVMGVEPVPFMPTILTAVNVVGGNGNDSISVLADVNAVMGIEPVPFLPDIETTVRADGDAGNDAIAVLADINAAMGVEPEPFQPAPIRFLLDARGGSGNDLLAARGIVSPGELVGFNPQPEPPLVQLSVRMDGGEGNDVLDALFLGFAELPLADLRIALFGGDGDDAIRLLWSEGAFDPLAFVDGGDGLDSGLFSPGVRHINVERVA